MQASALAASGSEGHFKIEVEGIISSLYIGVSFAFLCHYLGIVSMDKGCHNVSVFLFKSNWCLIGQTRREPFILLSNPYGRTVRGVLHNFSISVPSDGY